MAWKPLDRAWVTSGVWHDRKSVTVMAWFNHYYSDGCDEPRIHQGDTSIGVSVELGDREHTL
jgi:hypothetical protein